MTKYILKIEGMMCGHCEAHMNDTIRNHFKVEHVSSSHSKKECVIVAEELDEDKLRKAVADTGYELVSISSEPYKKKGLFSKFMK